MPGYVRWSELRVMVRVDNSRFELTSDNFRAADQPAIIEVQPYEPYDSSYPFIYYHFSSLLPAFSVPVLPDSSHCPVQE